ncbi:MAG: hypothetical protein H6595_11055 [Flavobacteriales bacterium]|nr:hypothetical protein [Flavobacteriales bacterium]MCB9168000.1 hypothetical protein [Flavobacteriales bacterium]
MKRSMTPALTFLFFASSLPFHLSGQSTAMKDCQCANVRLDDSWCLADLVFEGTAVSADTVFQVGEVKKYDTDPFHRVGVHFEVDKLLKGGPAYPMVVNTAMVDNDRMFRFITGRRYLVFATRDGERWRTDRCTPTRAADDIGPGFLDSLNYVREGHMWAGHRPLNVPCQ